MKTSRVFLGFVLVCSVGLRLEGAPSLVITKPPVQSTALLTGPPVDAAALRGQWFKDNLGAESVRSNEFYDESSGLGAGSAAIYGYVKSMQFAAPGSPPASILAFTVEATIYNNNNPAPVSSSGGNRHGESLVTLNEPPYAGAMVDTKLAVEFAVADLNRLPNLFVAPYRDRQPYIEATNEDQSAWYCWNPGDPEQSHQPKGDYFVPTWDFGTIPVGQSATRRLDFTVAGGLPFSDSRYAVLVGSLSQTNDILLNRTTSLKISTWIDEVAADTGGVQEEPPLRISNVSVFHNPAAEETLLDFGDAMDHLSSPMYPTLLAHNGARHVVVPGVFLGGLVDTEPDGQPTLNADGDDLNPAPDDEDGVLLPGVFVAGGSAQVLVAASVAGYLNAWLDWNANGSWADPGEQVFINTPLVPGVNHLLVVVPVPPALVAGGPHSRWRFTTSPVASPMYTGQENDGEVEDYEIRLEVLDFGDAPDPAFPTKLVNDGARHRIPSIYWLGGPPDLDPDGQPSASATGDDAAGSDDEDGVQAAGTLIRGSNITFRVLASTNGYLNAWMDWNGNQSWADIGEQMAFSLALTPGTNLLSATVPAGATLGSVIGRFRFTSVAAMNATGLAGDGEVEDHLFVIYQDGPGADIVITNLVRGSFMTVQWNGQSPLIYEVQFATNHMAATNLAWTPFSGWITGAPYEQLDTNGVEAMKFFRVVAPYAPPPP